jgi:hypothetical protein
VQYIDESSLPKEYGGKDVVSIMQSDEEARLRAYAKAKVRGLPIQMFEYLNAQMLKRTQTPSLVPILANPVNRNPSLQNMCEAPIVESHIVGFAPAPLYRWRRARRRRW